MTFKIYLIKMYTFLLKIIEKSSIFLGFSENSVLKAMRPLNKVRHNMIDKVIRRDNENLISNIEFIDGHTKKNKRTKINVENPVWVMWWQNDTPPIVSVNIEQMKKIFGDRLIVISKSNYRDYLIFDQTISKKIESNLINITALSDYIRTALLYLYGGLWIDSTYYITENYSDSVFIKNRKFYTTYGEWWYYNKFASEGRWTGNLMGGQQGELYFKLAHEIIRVYLLDEKRKPDYFVLDYILRIAFQDNIGNFKDRILDLEPVNQNVLKLAKVINEEFDSVLWQDIQENSFAFKLTYKKEYTKFIDGKPTFFEFLYGNRN